MKKKSKLQKTQDSGRNTLIAIFVIGIAVYLGFDPLFDRVGGGVAGSVLGASFGAIFVIVLTMYLLNKQTEIEQESKKSERVFDEKVALYKEILTATENMIEDGEITIEEVTKLPFTLMRLQMLGGDEAIDTYEKVFAKINEVFEKHDEDQVIIDEDEKLEIYKEMVTFAVQCRVDLGVSDRIVNDELFERTKRTIEKSSNLKVRRGSTEFFEGIDQFFKACKEKGRSPEIISSTRKLYEALQQRYPSEIQIDFPDFTKSQSACRLSVKSSSGEFCTVDVRPNDIRIGRIYKSPKWNYKQLLVGGELFFEHQKEDWRKLKIAIKDLNEQNLKAILFVLDESKETLQKKEVIDKKNITEEMKAGDYTEELKIEQIG